MRRRIGGQARCTLPHCGKQIGKEAGWLIILGFKGEPAHGKMGGPPPLSQQGSFTETRRSREEGQSPCHRSVHLLDQMWPRDKERGEPWDLPLGGKQPPLLLAACIVEKKNAHRRCSLCRCHVTCACVKHCYAIIHPSRATSSSERSTDSVCFHLIVYLLGIERIQHGTSTCGTIARAERGDLQQGLSHPLQFE